MIQLNDQKPYPVNIMCVNIGIWENLCELYPETAEILRELALLKREIMLHYMEINQKLSFNRRQTGIPISLSDGTSTPKKNIDLKK